MSQTRRRRQARRRQAKVDSLARWAAANLPLRGAKRAGFLAKYGRRP